MAALSRASLSRHSLFRNGLLCALLCWLLSAVALAESPPDSLVIIANRQADIAQLKKADLINIFMGRHRQLPGGATALPVDYQPGKQSFYRWLIDKNMAEVNAYWARLVFSGRANPPLQMSSASELLQFVANNRGAIGYIQAQDVDGTVAVVDVVSDELAQERK